MRELVASLEGEFKRYKALGDAALGQIPEAQLSKPLADGGNSAAVLVWHLAGNFSSRFTDFLISDGEKPWRQRDEEFDTRAVSRAELLTRWEAGWDVLFTAVASLADTDLQRTVTIRAVPFKVHEALHRALGHTAYHVGQLVFLAKAFCGDRWRCLTIPRGGSTQYNRNPVFDRLTAHAGALSAHPAEPVTFVDADPTGTEAVALLAELDADLMTRYPGQATHGIEATTLVPSGGAFLIARRGGVPAGCGALRPRELAVVEIKRMFVRANARRTGVARQLLAELERRAAMRGYAIARLETGTRQPEAIALYESAGYTRIPCYGEFADNPLSVCFEKRLI